MIRARVVIHVIGVFVLLLAAALLVPLFYALHADWSSLKPLALSFGICLVAGAVSFRAVRQVERDLSVREGLLVVALVWVVICGLGSLPFYLSGQFGGFTNAFFEATSGFTTTGATVLPRVEVLPPALQLWRCFTHWLGGMGIVLLGVAVLPLLSAGGMYLYRAEFSGARSEKLKPRITETALALWRVYAALTLTEFTLLWLAGLSSYEALCHTFSTLGTGGFSTRTASIAGFESPLVEWIIIVFMLLAGANFTRQYYLWIDRQPRRFFADIEVRFYFLIVLVGTAVITVVLLSNESLAFKDAVRVAAFQVTSITTTTGFVTADFEQWAPVAQLALFFLMFCGGCTGSTAGGLKVSRMLLLLKVVRREFRRLVERRGIFSVRMGDQVIPEQTIQNLLNLVYLALMVHVVATLILAALGQDIMTSISAVTACMFNVGPGLGTVGPAENYAHLPGLAKWVLSWCMIAGRLEFYTFLVVLFPDFWRK